MMNLQNEHCADARVPVDPLVGPLLSCPFCGKPPIVHETDNGWWVDCCNDWCSVQPRTQEPTHRREDAMSAWNKRV